MCILSSISSYCDSQIDGLCSGFAVVDYIFEAIFIITILICINISIFAMEFTPTQDSIKPP